MRVTIVICTYNRADGLRETLECIRHQSYSDFEVVVVNGPSTDHTEAVLAEYEGQVRVAHNPLRNLSVSRNLGIVQAAGEIVAFIDDDALPEFCWLEQALPAFEDPEVGGVGGIVFDHTGMALQYKYSAANRFGEVDYRDWAPFDSLSRVGGFLIPYLQGTNVLFRRDALARIGMFDETFDYYLDETDVCIRMVDAGYVMRQLPNATVHHKFLPSHIRNSERVVSNWFPIVKNMVYFGYRHALPDATELEVIERGTRFARQFVEDATSHEEGGRLPKGSREECERVVGEAIAAGIALGRERADLRLPVAVLNNSDFLPYPTISSDTRRCWVMVSSGYPPDVTGGIARYIGEVAPALAAMGHEIRVITRGSAGGTVDLEDGVWVHRIDSRRDAPGAVDEIPGPIDAFATGVIDEIGRISAWTTPDVVYGPAWDVEVLGVVRSLPSPVCTFLATPLDIIAEQSRMLDDPAAAPTVERLLKLERELFQKTDLAHADSRAVLRTIAGRYDDPINPQKAGVALLGLADRGAFAPPADYARRFLYVGRLEPRKGIDHLLKAFSSVAEQHDDVMLVVVGSDGPIPGGSCTYSEQFRRDHEGESVLEKVIFLGRVDDEELEHQHKLADCLVLPSLYESFGLTMLHAMLTNRAVISCDVGAIPEVVRDGIDGLLVPPGDSDSLEAAIAMMVTERGLARRLAANGRKRYLEQFQIEQSAEGLAALFNRVSTDRSMSWLSSDGPMTPCAVYGQPGLSAASGTTLRIEALRSGDAGHHILFTIPRGATDITVNAKHGHDELTLTPDRVGRIPISADGPTTISVNSGQLIVFALVRVADTEEFGE